MRKKDSRNGERDGDMGVEKLEANVGKEQVFIEKAVRSEQNSFL